MVWSVEPGAPLQASIRHQIRRKQMAGRQPGHPCEPGGDAPKQLRVASLQLPPQLAAARVEAHFMPQLESLLQPEGSPLGMPAALPVSAAAAGAAAVGGGSGGVGGWVPRQGGCASHLRPSS